MSRSDQSRARTKVRGTYRALWTVIAILAALIPRASALAQLTRQLSPMAEAERMQLDLYLRVGRTVAGTRWQEQNFINTYTNRFPNPFGRVLQEADLVGLTDDQADSIAVLSRAYTITTDSILRPAARYLGTLPTTYDINQAWSRLSPALTAIVDRSVGFAARGRKVLTADQLAKLRPEVRRMLDSACIRGRDPTFGSGRIGGGGAAGGGRLVVPGC
jgi:hypothetical protein